MSASNHSNTISVPPIESERIWSCKIGGVGYLPPASDPPMRAAIQHAFYQVTGREALFCFSGWGATLTDGERAVVEDRPPNPNNESLESQIERLANFICEHVPGEPSQSQGAVDTAIRIMGDMIAANARLSRPAWFYAEGWEEYCFHSPHEAVDFIDPTESAVVEIACAAPLPSIWCAVRVSDDEDADERWTLTEHASENEARAALNPSERNP